MDGVVAWKKLEEKALSGGGLEKIDRQLQSGKQTARVRIDQLLDEGSFQEVDRLARSAYSLLQEYTDGVITGFGRISGRSVALYAQDFTIKGGSLGKRHAEKICKIMDMAAKMGCPIIGIIDSGGARIDEGIHALSGYGQIFMRNVRYSGVIPQISLIMGPCAGGATYSPALTDIIITTESISQLFITGPQVIEQVLGQKISKDALGGTWVHAQQSGVSHLVAQSEQDCFEKVKILLSYLPNNYCAHQEYSPQEYSQDSLNNNLDFNNNINLCDSLDSLVPTSGSQGYDMHLVISRIIDQDSFFELQEYFAQNIITGFARFNGLTVGIIANQPSVKAGSIDIDASCKASRFIRFCDSFSIPLVSLVDVPGFLPGVDQEHNGIIRHGAKLIYAYASATVPKITVILRKAYGGAYIVMGSKELGADFNFAWPQAQIAVLGAKGAVAVLHGKTIAGVPESERTGVTQQLEQEYQETFLNPFIAAEHGYIDAIIKPSQTRECIINALKFSQDKVEILPKRKHGNIPL
jgi:acetyl-CoA carboxylase carboxyltransferase component